MRNKIDLLEEDRIEIEGKDKLLEDLLEYGENYFKMGDYKINISGIDKDSFILTFNNFEITKEMRDILKNIFVGTVIVRDYVICDKKDIYEMIKGIVSYKELAMFI